MSAVELEKLLHIIDKECRARHRTEHPDNHLPTPKEFKKMRSHSRLTQ